MHLNAAEPTELTPSQYLKFLDVWSSLKDYRVRVFGTGGIGKTTILKKVDTDLIEHPLDFDVVIFARNKSPDERTINISTVLSKMKFVLLLEDIWPGFDFAQVGVPLPEESQNKSKVVFTTRSEKVCDDMNADRRFIVEALPAEERWTMFLKTVGEETVGSNPRIRELAVDIANECGVLPLAIVTIGRVLAKQRNEEVLEETLIRLGKSDLPEFFGMIEILFHNLKLSNGLLEDEVTRSCCRYCSLLPPVDRDQFIDYWIGEGFLGESTPNTINES
ncbi:hypothetical protein LguiB_023198 [Lonicera macranthoides]